jgi:diguanylate cyclase (GGDEF)-like protein
VRLRGKIGLAITGFILTALLVSGFFRFEAEREIYRSQMVQRGIALLHSLAIPCSIAMANHDSSTLDDYLAGFVDSGRVMDIYYLTILDSQRRVLSDTRAGFFQKVLDDDFMKKAAQSSGASFRTTRLNGEEAIEVAVPVISGLRWGTLVAGFRLDRLEQELRQRTIRFTLAASLVAFLAGVLAFWILSSMVMTPVVRMRNMAERFGKGDHDVRVADGERRDELGQLGRQLDQMAEQIQNYTHGLETLVEERTQELAESNLMLRQANTRLEALARTDELTGLCNRRHFMTQLGFEVTRGRRTVHQFTLIMLDLDHFKHYNDTNGHPMGDALLRSFSQLLTQTLRQTDLIGRYGGEEFIIMLLDTSPEEGIRTAEKLRAAIESASFSGGGQQPGGRVTASLGAAFFPADAQTEHELIDCADRALYLSKEKGRNSVSTWSQVVGVSS